MNVNRINSSLTFSIIFLFLVNLSVIAQVNTSQEINYKARANGFHSYATVYDNGYVQLNDGTRLEGKISLIGTSYLNVYGVRIRTNSGHKYSFYTRSLSEFGLSNSIVNDTPGEFTWNDIDRGIGKFVTGTSGGNQTTREGRNGYAAFGYVITKDGKTYEGQVDIKEVKQKIKKIDIKTVKKEKFSFNVEEISNFGVKKYVDEKFNTSLSLLKWEYSKSSPTAGFVELNEGQKHTGKLTLIKQGEIVNQVQVRPMTGKGKAIKIKYKDIKNYGINIDIHHMYDLMKSTRIPFDLIHPERKFFPGTVQLEDGTIKEGLIAKSKPGSISDVYFTQTENSEIEVFEASEVDIAAQLLPEGTMEGYRQRLYDATHIQDYPIDQKTRWKYKTRNEGSSRTEYMWGYLVFRDGTAKVGYVSIKRVGALTTYFLRQGKEETKYKSIKRYGLLASKEKDIPKATQNVAIQSDNEEFEAYDPLEASFLATKTTEENIESNGYVITSSGEKKEGAVSVSAPPKLWFATDVTLTSLDGTVSNYTNDGSLKKIVLTLSGEEKEFVNFENEYVEVLHRDGDLVHIRNPHPTTTAVGGDLANAVAGAALESLDQGLNSLGKVTSGSDNAGITKSSGEKVDWTNEEIIKRYAKEYLILNVKTGKYAMYIPRKNYNQVEGDLMGSIEYLEMNKENRNVFRKMANPLTTMKFLNEKIYNKN